MTEQQRETLSAMLDNEADELESALAESLTIERPSLIEVPVGMMPNPFG